jgi:hypothetical protein
MTDWRIHPDKILKYLLSDASAVAAAKNWFFRVPVIHRSPGTSRNGVVRTPNGIGTTQNDGNDPW